MTRPARGPHVNHVVPGNVERAVQHAVCRESIRRPVRLKGPWVDVESFEVECHAPHASTEAAIRLICRVVVRGAESLRKRTHGVGDAQMRVAKLAVRTKAEQADGPERVTPDEV